MNQANISNGRLPWLAALARRRWGRILLIVLVIPTLIMLVLGILVWRRLNDDRPVIYANIEEHFKYGSTGGERESGFPYWIFQALPQVCEQHLPGKGYASLGLIFEEGKDLPVGMSQRSYQGVDRTFLNCAVCHTSTVRDTPEAKPRVVLGMPANTFDLWSFEKFFFDCARDPKFSKEFVVPEVARLMKARGEKLALMDRYLVYPVAVWLMRERLLMLRGRFEPLLQYPAWGPGRVDTFNPNKALFNFPLASLPEHEKNAPSDFPSIWLQKPRQGMYLHWDGNNGMAEERNKNAAFGTGTTPPTIDLAAIGRLEQWMLTLEPPKYPYPIDSAKASRGEPTYKYYCSSCHGASGRDFAAAQEAKARECQKSGDDDTNIYGPYVGKITRLEEVGTDRRRLDSFSYDLAVSLGTVYAGYSHRYCHYRKTYGYANMPLDGIWLRAPYLHNGSVPTLRDLLEPSSKRTKVFYRGYDVYDQLNVGFKSDIAEADRKRYFKYDVSVPGNSNMGHEGKHYGTELSAVDKDALLEYLKTF